MKNGERIFWLLAVLAVIGIWIATAKGCWKRQAHKEQAEVFTQKADTPKQYTDAAGRQHAQATQARGERDVIEYAYQREIDSFRKAFKIVKKQLDKFTMIGTVVQGEVKPQITTVDSSNPCNFEFAYQDDWLQLEGEKTHDLLIRYKVTDSIHLGNYWKRKWFAGRKTYYADGYSLNDNAEIKGLQDVQIVTVKPNRFNMGPSLGYGWNGQRLDWFAGFTFQYTIIGF